MSYLADSNILTSLAKRQSPQYMNARRSLTVLRKRGETICLIPQNLIEFWAVSTRPVAANGLGLSIEKTSLEVRKFKRYFNFFDDVSNIYSQWENLVTVHQVSGKRCPPCSRDARTRNLQSSDVQRKRLKRFDEITVADPHGIV